MKVVVIGGGWSGVAAAIEAKKWEQMWFFLKRQIYY